jgi:hypothetical protein
VRSEGDGVGDGGGECADEALEHGDAVLHHGEDGDTVVHLLQLRQNRLAREHGVRRQAERRGMGSRNLQADSRVGRE